VNRGSKHGIDRKEWHLRRFEFVARGNRLPQAKLTPELVREIRGKYRPFSKEAGAPALARQYGLHRRTVEKVLTRETWGTV
jgi:hypothetical protein